MVTSFCNCSPIIQRRELGTASPSKSIFGSTAAYCVFLQYPRSVVLGMRTTTKPSMALVRRPIGHAAVAAGAMMQRPRGPEPAASARTARTLTVNTLVMFEIFYLWSARYLNAPVLNVRGLLSNRYIPGRGRRIAGLSGGLYLLGTGTGHVRHRARLVAHHRHRRIGAVTGGIEEDLDPPPPRRRTN